MPATYDGEAGGDAVRCGRRGGCRQFVAAVGRCVTPRVKRRSFDAGTTHAIVAQMSSLAGRGQSVIAKNLRDGCQVPIQSLDHTLRPSDVAGARRTLAIAASYPNDGWPPHAWTRPPLFEAGALSKSLSGAHAAEQRLGMEPGDRSRWPPRIKFGKIEHARLISGGRCDRPADQGFTARRGRRAVLAGRWEGLLDEPATSARPTRADDENVGAGLRWACLRAVGADECSHNSSPAGVDMVEMEHVAQRRIPGGT